MIWVSKRRRGVDRLLTHTLRSVSAVHIFDIKVWTPHCFDVFCLLAARDVEHVLNEESKDCISCSDRLAANLIEIRSGVSCQAQERALGVTKSVIDLIPSNVDGLRINRDLGDSKQSAE